MGEAMILRLPDGREIHGSLDEILAVLNSMRSSVPVVSMELIDEFTMWLEGQGISLRTIRDYSRSLGKLVGMSLDEVKPSGLQVKALRKYIVFLWEKGVIGFEDKQRYLARFRARRSSGQRYYVLDRETVKKMREALSRRGRTGLILRVLYFSGARASEPVYMIGNWSPDEEIILPGGFISKRLVCRDMHCRYYLGWNRGRKRCEWIFFPKKLLGGIEEYAGNPLSYEYVRVLRSKLGFPVKLYRKYFYNVCVKATGKPDLCSFIESRSGGVSREHYMDVLRFADEIYPVVLKALDKARY